MIKSLVIIPARGGSKGVSKKNIKLLAGKPLIAYTIEVALKVFPKEDICVSTDSKEISFEAEKLGIDVRFRRPKELAKDTTSMREVLIHAIEFYEKRNVYYNTVVLLQPTSPFRTDEHIKKAIDIYSNYEDINMVVSVRESKSNPYYNLFEEEKGILRKSKEGNFLRRQDIPKVYEYNGAIYVISINKLKENEISSFEKVKKFVMDDISSLDIDSMLDWKICEQIIEHKLINI